MAEYIEREPLIKYCTAMLNLAQRLVKSGYGESDIWKAIHQTQREEREEFLKILESALAVDVAPVRHGRWIFGNGLITLVVLNVDIKNFLKMKA